MTNSPESRPYADDDSINFAELFARLRRGLIQIFGLTLLGLALGIIVTVLTASRQSAITTLRVTFGFPGFEAGAYPNGAKFQPDDVRAPDVVNEAIKRLGLRLEDTDLASKIRGAISISGLVSPNIIKERDLLRASGQSLPAYIPDEYEITLSLPRDFPVDVRQRELLLAEIINVYLEKFRRTYVELPPEFGNAFTSLRNADFVEYELILTKETLSLSAFLQQQIEKAKQFRSPSNQLSFQDLLKQTELFTQIRLNDVLGLIYINGLSKDRGYALVKMDYYMRTLADQEQRLTQEAEVVTNLLTKTQERAQNYVLATRAQQPQGTQPLLDQGFIDTLLANDAYNFLVREALKTGLAVKRVQSDIAQLEDRRQRMESFTKGESKDQAAAIASTQKALVELEASYQELLSKVRIALDDYSRQEFADAIRVSMQARTASMLRNVVLGAIIGLVAGSALGMGLSLLKPAGRVAA
ncbi:hypothetical protein Verru16b_02048 [Lacunisphaera limnophila]|uniref:Chain length determinant protein n=1 Tax=Lacunisphaera limnophila TaxID=1838286 RepID=A0A1D8AVQ7_9BACT|nr:hypothetical protein [Lacunisphaera limnophila]AOS44979.1 hypothetical protein Verru16b_02048 [Lacunisphaera limnophila]